MKNIFAIVLLLFNCICNGQLKYDESVISNKVKIIVNSISKANILDDEFIGIAATKSKQYENFEQLKKATTTELLMLTNHSNAVIRCYSFWALGYHSDTDVFKIVKDHLNDNEPVEYQSGCTTSTEKVGDFYISLVTPNYIDLNVQKIDESERKRLDSILVYQPNELEARYKAIENAKETPKLYSFLRNLYLKTNNQSALVKLSKYNQREDIPLILANRENHKDKELGYYYTYKAIENFPDKKFIPFLNERLEETLNEKYFSQEWRELYYAIAIYKSQEALELLNIPFSKVQYDHIKKYHFDFIYNAVLKNFSPIYSEVLWKIWEQDNEITLRGYKFYLKNDIKRGYDLTLKKLGVKNLNNENLPSFNESIFTDKLEESMFNLVLLNDKDLAYDIIKNKILDADVDSFAIYTSYINKNKDIIFVDFLFQRLKKESNPYIYLEIAKTLIKFEDKNINNRILEALKINHSLTEGWGNEELLKLLKENNIMQNDSFK